MDTSLLGLTVQSAELTHRTAQGRPVRVKHAA